MYGCKYAPDGARGFCLYHYNVYNTKTRRSGIFKWDDVERMMVDGMILTEEEMEFLKDIKTKKLDSTQEFGV
jgi:hypothetical protein